ncbi:MAG: two-component system, OmpR family, operon response regulator KdpE [Alphaproteobacteria bacterium]|jgi:two-component system KDP operon response regulator KdpE|nr:two-component system, OmpR family, operon response regulator KdpE [Alphaproteobacteria bacterium]
MKMPARSVLIVDDEKQIRRFLRSGFEIEGFHVREAASAVEALHSINLNSPDVIILDLAMPDNEGDEVVRQLRTWSRIPIIVLSVRSSEAEKVRLLELGADDYVVKPFGMGELLARVRAALRRQHEVNPKQSVFTVGRISIDIGSHTASLDGAKIVLPPKEFRLLQVLAQHAGRVVTHQRLLNEVWGPTHVADTHYLRIFVRKLRQKIEADATQPSILLTELGVGYRLAAPDPVENISAVSEAG